MSAPQAEPEVKPTTVSTSPEASPVFKGPKRQRPKSSNSSTPGGNKARKEDEASDNTSSEEIEDIEVTKTRSIEPVNSGRMAPVLHDRSQNPSRPFKDWEGAHPPTKDLNKSAQCASYAYTINHLTNKFSNLDVTATHPEQLHKHMLGREFC